MTGYYLRVEGVNLASVMDDTQDLSTQRGASLMLLDVIEAIGKKLESPWKAEAVTTGASIGVWRLPDADLAGAKKAAGEIRGLLKQGGAPLLRAARHATFVVDVTPDSGDYAEARERLIAANRWRQMTNPSVVYPEAGGESRALGSERICALDLKRPALPDKRPLKGDETPISQSVWDRRGYGLEKKQLFYAKEIGKSIKADELGLRFPDKIPQDESRPFPLHFESIAEQDASLPRPLRDKIAVLYIDGNSFSKIQNTLVSDDTSNLGETSEARQRAIDTKLKGYRRDFLWRLLWMLAEANATGPPAPKEADERRKLKIVEPEGGYRVARVEVLLWGGDEFMIALPARLGWRAARLFFDLAAGADNEITNGKGARPLAHKTGWRLGGTPLKHGGALVFCHHNAAIARIRHLAKDDLAEQAKTVKEQCRLAPLVLESFDHAGVDIERFWKKRCPTGLELDWLMLPEGALGPIEEAARALKGDGPQSHFPRRRLRNLAAALYEGGLDGETYGDLLAAAKADYRDLFDGEEMNAAHRALARLGVDPRASEAVLIYYLEELWDYVTCSRPGASPSP